MANAIIVNLIEKNIIITDNLYVYDMDKEKCRLLSKRGVKVSNDSAELCCSCDIIFLAVKPQNYPEVLAEIKDSINDEKILVSIAAGISIQLIQSLAGKECKVVRTMPNTPLLLGCGATAMCKSENVTDSEFETIKGYFDASGITEMIPEERMNEIISVNGSSPAYIYLFAKAVADYAENNGIDRSAAIRLFAKTLEGSARMITESEKSLDELITMVCSPGGTTLKAVETFKKRSFEETVAAAMEACTKRAEELSAVNTP